MKEEIEYHVICLEEFSPAAVKEGFPEGPNKLSSYGPFSTPEAAALRMKELQEFYVENGWVKKSNGFIYQADSTKDSDYHFWFTIQQK